MLNKRLQHRYYGMKRDTRWFVFFMEFVFHNLRTMAGCSGYLCPNGDNREGAGAMTVIDQECWSRIDSTGAVDPGLHRRAGSERDPKRVTRQSLPGKVGGHGDYRRYIVFGTRVKHHLGGKFVNLWKRLAWEVWVSGSLRPMRGGLRGTWGGAWHGSPGASSPRQAAPIKETS